MLFPEFRYHLNPLATGAIKDSDAVCACCGQARGFVYTASFYSAKIDEPVLCPWCIANGDAAVKYDGQFADGSPLRAAGVDDEIVNEVCRRTPGYNSWQQDVWQSHCKDACVFCGDAEQSELLGLSDAAVAELLRQSGLTVGNWPKILRSYRKGGDPAVYKFCCLHCSKTIYYFDCA